MAVDWTRVDTSLLEAKFFADVNLLLDKEPYNWVVTEGSRHISRSNKLFIDYRLHGGPRAAPGGLSPHNYGMAIDVGLIINGKMNWITTHPAWVSLVASIWKHPRLRSGKWYSDWPHIEKLKWKDYTNWRQLYEDNVTYLRSVDGLSKYLPSVTSA